ncbi:MAG: hypothetical protein KJ792_05435 [Actinobacteria bacterium]|nr:hypothetical protein [Actinomycetota bacterium]MCG2801236.1 hypothetical protein [Cellulomonas sp.]
MTSLSRLAELAGHSSARVRDAVALNPSTDDATLLRLAYDDRAEVRIGAAVTGGSRPALEGDLAASPDKWVRAILAHAYAAAPHLQLLRPTQERLTEDSFYEVRERIAETTAHRDLFERLLADPDPRVRGRCGSNPRALRTDMDRLLGDRHLEARRVAVTFGALFPDEEQTLRAAQDRSAEVRWAVLFRAGAPRSVAIALADDPDESVRDHARSAVRDRGGVWEPLGEAEALAERGGLAAAGLTFDGEHRG